MDYSALYNRALEAYAKIPYYLCNGRAFRPMTLFVEVTYRCNFRCNMCQFLTLMDDPAVKAKRGEELSATEINRVIDDVVPRGLISFTGGEPLLRRDIMEMVRHACKRHKSYLVTNGILLKEEIADEMASLGCNHLLSSGMAVVGVSLEAMGKTHDDIVQAPGSFDAILRNVRYLLSAREKTGKKFPLVALKCVITQSNVHQLDDLYKFAERVGVDIFNPITFYNIPVVNRFEMTDAFAPDAAVPPMVGFDVPLLADQLAKLFDRAERSKVQLRLTPPGISREDVIAIYDNRLSLADKACYSPWSSAALNAYGEVFPCSNYGVGNIRNESFLKLWNNEKMRRFRRELKKRRIFKACSACCAMVTEG